MSNFIQLNPYEGIVQALETFVETHIEDLSDLMLRPYQSNPDQRIREMNISKEVLDANGLYIGLVNINILNEKFKANNLITTKTRRFSNLDNSAQEVTPEWFKQKFVDDREFLAFQISFKQFRSSALGLGDLTYSTRYWHIVDEPWGVTRLSREDTSHMWNDPAIVLGTRSFFTQHIETILTSWTPDIVDITQQTVISIGT